MAETTVSIPFGSGVDTKTDPKMVSPPKLTLLQDAVFTNRERVTKRNGYTAMTKAIVGGGTWSSPTMSKSYLDELLLAATTSNGQRLLSYSESLNAWSDRGKYLSIAVSKQDIASINQTVGATPTGGTSACSCAALGNYQLYSYYTSNNSNVYMAVIDSSTGMHLESASNSLVSTNATLPKTVLLGSSALGIVYVSGGSSLVLSIITVTSGGVVVGAPITIASGAGISTFDVQTTTTGAVIGYYKNASTTVSLSTVDTSGAVLNTASISSAGIASLISLNVDSAGQIWVYWPDNTTPGSNTLYGAVFSSVLASVLAKTSIATGLNRVNNITAVNASTTQQIFYFSTLYTDNTTPTINSGTLTSAGVVGSPAVYLNNVDIYSKIATLGGRNYMAVVFTSNLTPTGMIIDTADGIPVAKFLPDQADGIVGIRAGSAQRTLGFINNLILLSSSKLLLCSGYVSTLVPSTNTASTGLIETNLWATISTAGITFDFNNIDAYQGLVQDDALVLNGGLVYQYDHSNVVELGFTTNPEVIGSVSSSGGAISTGSWLYYTTYEWLDSNGNLHESAPSIAYRAVFGSGSTNSVSILAKSYTATQKSNVSVVLWKTTSNGVIAYRLDTQPNDPTSNYVSFSDLGATSDATIQNNQPLYTQGGAILENLAPPPSMILWSGLNRLWCVDSENPETTIEYSKTASKGTGISFSTGQLELVIDSAYGAISGGSKMDEKTVILKQGGVGYFYGDGANDAGTSSSITQFQFIPSDTGCTNSKSIILFPGGILYRTPKGIYLVSRGIQTTYFGVDVDGYNSQDIQSAFIVPDKQQIRFLTSSGSSLLYDYEFNQWSVFTNHTGYSATSFNGSYVYVRTDGNVYLENQTSFLDNTTPYAPLLQLSWIKATSIQGFQRCRRVALLGDFQGASGHGVQISVAYDFNPSFSAPVPYYFSGSNGVYQYRERLSRQKCDSFQLKIQEITTGASGEYIDFSDLGIEIMAKTGLNKLPASQTVG